jgi:tetratricopeptide (TPR) repeat protein
VALGRLHRLLASRALDENTRRDQFALSLKFYEQATRLGPNEAHLYNEWGTTHAMAGQFEEAISKYQQSIAIDPEFNKNYRGLRDVYRSRSKLAGGEEARRRDLAKAEEAHRKSLEKR